MKQYIYPAYFYEEKEGGYSVLFPDFSCGTCGDTLDEAYSMAVDFLYVQISELLENKEKLPKPSEIDKIKPETDWEYVRAFSSLISVDIKEYANKLAEKEKSIRKNVTIPAWLSQLAEKEHINYSAVLQEALKKQLDLQ